ncbi:hypothetical protein CXG81DRAFT_26508 [Caulochytrium protostelioides]|uniref:Kinase n=1 Tax=Caulochytrium protostelioides TaxID=1555241 RepID=A0A4P9X6I4_9FUNG|nr:hypothetical protein CXG81DRAFT_26508 [Caulochytrium protostelioides]|eukprot:RKP00807.1 hypothetical protein CXG81DRAFT_26508 [Caulochytrium protostelioides]
MTVHAAVAATAWAAATDSASRRPLRLQVAGHAGQFHAAAPGTLHKHTNRVEARFYRDAQTGAACAAGLPAFLPAFRGIVVASDAVDGEAVGAPDGVVPRLDAPIGLAAGSAAGDASDDDAAQGPATIALADVLTAFLQPHVLDIKLGTVLWDRWATPAKRDRMQQQAAATTSAAVGLRICGMALSARLPLPSKGPAATKDGAVDAVDAVDAVVDDLLAQARLDPAAAAQLRPSLAQGVTLTRLPETPFSPSPCPPSLQVQWDKTLGRTLPAAALPAALEIFLAAATPAQRRALAARVSALQATLHQLPHLVCIGCSLLMIYDTAPEGPPCTLGDDHDHDHDHGDGGGGSGHAGSTPSLANAWLIDFAHSEVAGAPAYPADAAAAIRDGVHAGLAQLAAWILASS